MVGWTRSGALLVMILAGLEATAWAGGAWAPDPGQGNLYIGYSRKTAHTSWDVFGESFDNMTNFEGERVPHHHDFKYLTMSGEFGIVKGLSAGFLVTYLFGLEGPEADMEENNGMSDAWFSLKYQFLRGDWPMAFGSTLRSPVFYDVPGPYTRHLFNDDGEEVTVSPEWRGVLKRDLSMWYTVSRSLNQGLGWASLYAGYTFREGAPADQIPLGLEAGYRIPVKFRPLSFKAIVTYVGSLGNDSLREPEDRFGSSDTFNFNNASMLRVGGSLILEVVKGVDAELGYAQWVWGHSARQYNEPFFSVGYRW